MAAPVGRDDALAAIVTMESHGNVHDQRATVDPGLYAAHPCRSPLIVLPEFCNEARESLGPDPDI